MSSERRSMRIGEVYLMFFSGIGSEQKGMRPGLVFQNNTGNTHSPNIIALPLTRAYKKPDQPTHVLLSSEKNGLKADSMVLCENPQRMSKERVGQYLTTLSDEDMARIAEAYLIATGAISFIKPDDLPGIWEKAAALNIA